MKKNSSEELRAKPEKSILADIVSLRKEILKEKLEAKVNPPKDTNNLSKKRRKLALLLTVLREKRENK